MIFAVMTQYLIKDIRTVRDSRPLFILRNINLDNDSKMGMKIGKLPYDYTMFIKDNTSPNSTILIPPQGYPWDKTGNVGYLRYLLFPRSLINGNEKDSSVDINNVDYVLIDYGETNVSEYGYTNVWPKFNINGEYIIYWDPTTQRTWQDNSGVYKYSMNDKNERWGIIKIKK